MSLGIFYAPLTHLLLTIYVLVTVIQFINIICGNCQWRAQRQRCPGDGGVVFRHDGRFHGFFGGGANGEDAMAL